MIIRDSYYTMFIEMLNLHLFIVVLPKQSHFVFIHLMFSYLCISFIKSNFSHFKINAPSGGHRSVFEAFMGLGGSACFLSIFVGWSRGRIVACRMNEVILGF